MELLFSSLLCLQSKRKKWHRKPLPAFRIVGNRKKAISTKERNAQTNFICLVSTGIFLFFVNSMVSSLFSTLHAFFPAAFDISLPCLLDET